MRYPTVNESMRDRWRVASGNGFALARLGAIAELRDDLEELERRLAQALKEHHTWDELAAVVGLSRTGVMWRYRGSLPA